MTVAAPPPTYQAATATDRRDAVKRPQPGPPQRCCLANETTGSQHRAFLVDAALAWSPIATLPAVPFCIFDATAQH
jgi:hypothetical protein